MHIGLYCRGWPVNEYANGIVTYVDAIRRALMDQGHRVSVFVGELGQTNSDAGIYQVKPTLRYRVLSRFSGPVQKSSHDVFHWGKAIAAKVNDVARSDPIDVFEMEESFGWCADVQDRVPMPVVVRLHGPEFLTLISARGQVEFASARIEAEGKGLRRVRAVIAPSSSTLRDTVSHYDLDPPIRAVIPIPMALEAEPRLWRLESCEATTLLFVGQFSNVKGGDTVLIAFRRLLEMDQRLKLIFVGPDAGVTLANGSRVNFEAFRDSLFAESQRRSISYLGKLPRAEIFELRTKAFASIVTSRWESQCYTALEAMIQGCPIVVTDVGGLKEVAEDEITGLIARCDDIDNICQKVKSLLDDPQKARTMGENARRFVTVRHSGDRLARAAVDVYRQAISTACVGTR